MTLVKLIVLSCITKLSKEGSSFLYKNNKGKPVKYIENEPLFDEITDCLNMYLINQKNQYQHLKIQQKI